MNEKKDAVLLVRRVRQIADVGIVNARADRADLYAAADALEALDERVAIMSEFGGARLLPAEELRDIQGGGRLYWFDFYQGGCYPGLIAVIDDIGERIAFPVIVQGKRDASVRRTYIENYGVSWRCWTDQPTEEQRRETPWALDRDDWDEHRHSWLISEE